MPDKAPGRTAWRNGFISEFTQRPWERRHLAAAARMAALPDAQLMCLFYPDGDGMTVGVNRLLRSYRRLGLPEVRRQMAISVGSAKKMEKIIVDNNIIDA
jgi:hypothetical protein